MTFADGHNQVFLGTAGRSTFGRGETLPPAALLRVRLVGEGGSALAGAFRGSRGGQTMVELHPQRLPGAPLRPLAGGASKGSAVRSYFFPWWWEPAYRAERPAEDLTGEELEPSMRGTQLDAYQIGWRRAKRRSLKRLFPQEYPENPTDCFLNFAGVITSLLT